jgi:hypothetical protein
MHSRGGAISTRARWAGEGGYDVQRERGPVWRTGSGSREDSNKKLIFKFQMNLEFGSTLRNSTMRFRRNLDMRIFPELFYAS